MSCSSRFNPVFAEARADGFRYEGRFPPAGADENLSSPGGPGYNAAMRERAFTMSYGTALGVVLLALSSCGSGSIFWGGYSFDRRGETAERGLAGELGPEIRSISIDNVFGAVYVTATPGDFGWEWMLTCWGTTQADADRLLQEIKLVTEQENGVASWRLELPEPPVPELRGVESNLLRKVPAAVMVTTSNEHGPTVIAGITGGTTVRSRHGRVDVSDLADRFAISNAHGSVKAERVPGGSIENEHGLVSACVVGGDLTVRNAHGSVAVEDVVGSLAVVNGHGEVTVNTVRRSATITTRLLMRSGCSAE